MSYAQNAQEIVAAELRAVDPAFATRSAPAVEDMLRFYTLLCLVRGEATSAEDVHQAWALATIRYNPAHRSLVPFGELAPEVRAMDEPYRDAIRRAARRVRGEGA